MALIVVAALVVLFLILCLVKVPRPSTPGPHGSFLLGNWAELRGQPLYQVLTHWSQRYGDFFFYKTGSNAVLVVNSPAAFDELFVKKGPLYNSRPMNSTQTHRVTGDSRGVALPYGEPWKERRRVLQNLLSGQNSKFFLPYQNFESKKTLLHLLTKPEAFYQETIRYSSSVTFSMLLGARFENADSFVPTKIRDEMGLFWQHIAPGVWLTDWFPIFDYLPSVLAPWRKRSAWMHNRWYTFWSIFYDRIHQRYNDGIAQDCFLARFLAEPEIEGWSHIDSVGIVGEVLSAGTETTITSLQWFFRAGIYFPDAFKLAQEEIDRVVGRNRVPDWADRPNLPYVEAFIQELHRWASVSPLAVSHVTTGSDIFRGYHVPKGITVVPNTYGVHHDAQIYPDPERFLPARFLPSDHPLYPKDIATTSRHYAFGVGRRACPGISVANSSLYIVMSRVLWGFNIAAAPSGPPKLEIKPSPLVLPLAPFECAITPRDEETAELIRQEISTLQPPPQLESASVYEKLVTAWDRENPPWSASRSPKT